MKNIEESREKLKKSFEKYGVDLDTVVDYWGTKISLKNLIPKLAESDFKDAKKILRDLKELSLIAKTKKCPLCKKQVREDAEKYLCDSCNFVWFKRDR